MLVVKKKLVVVYSLFRQQIYYFNFKYPKQYCVKLIFNRL